MAEVIWLYIGNGAAIDSSPTTNVTQTQLNSSWINGYTATGRNELAPVTLNGTTYPSNFGPAFFTRFNPSYDIYGNAYSSRFTYERPFDQGAATSIRIQTTFRADVIITDNEGNQRTEEATVVQMPNGDVFFRPYAGAVDDWAGITSLRSIQIVDPFPFPNNIVLNSTISFDPSIFNIDIAPCFAAGKLILTPQGEVPAEALARGDLVMTADAGAQPIRWIAARELDAAALAANPHLRPVRIRAGALGAGVPARDLVVSPQHRVLLRSGIARRMFGASEVLVAAKQLLALDGVELASDLDSVTYVHFLFDRHQIVQSEGAWTESLYTGPEALRAIGPDARAEIETLFPEAITAAPAREVIPGRMARKLAERHAQNHKPADL
ncbi:MAG: Hint domain-containing protein [Paracoccus sp. (in: a-proteobacteria)]|nr:Hint domain-containing protein [Paracoccus sp. (in: a-proteobacteria)]